MEPEFVSIKKKLGRKKKFESAKDRIKFHNERKRLLKNFQKIQKFVHDLETIQCTTDYVNHGYNIELIKKVHGYIREIECTKDEIVKAKYEAWKKE